METSKCSSQLILILILTTLILFPGVVWAQAAQKSIVMDDGLKTVSESQKLPVIVQFQSAPTEAEYDQLEKQIGAFVLKHKYSIIPGMAAELTKGQIETLSRMSIVRSVEYDQPVRAFLDSATYWFGVDNVTDPDPNDPNAPLVLPVTGAGITIAIIDTGIDARHVDLNGGKVIGWKDFVDDQRNPYDDHGHGTHVASIAAGSGDGNPDYKGVAPGASLVGVKVLNSTGSGDVNGIIAGIDWCADMNNDGTPENDIHIINLSLGTVSPGTSQGLVNACANAVNSGIVVVVAAGDDGPPTKTIVGSPRYMEEVITVGAMADPGQKGFYQWYKSSRGDPDIAAIKPDISAPGYKIMAAKAGSRNRYIEMDGTSMASAFVAGVAALILDGDDTLSPAEVRSQIMVTAEDWGPPGPDPDRDYGAGKLDAYRAVTGDLNLLNADISKVNHFYKTEDLPKKGASDYWKFEVTDIESDDGIPYPIALTLIMDGWVDNNYNFDVYLYDPDYETDPNHSLVDISFGSMRQEMLGSYQAVPGTYTLEIRSCKGGGSYFFDLSAVASEPVLTPVNDDYVLTDIAIASINAPSQVVHGSSVNVGVIVENVGTLDVSSNVIVTLTDDTSATTIGTKTISGGLEAYTSTPLIFVWDTTSAALGDHILIASHDFTDDEPTNNSESTTVTVSEGSTNFMHVADIHMELTQAGPNTSAIATVTIADASGDPVPGALVEGSWSGNIYIGGIDSGVTDLSGKVSFKSDKVRKPDPGTVFAFRVRDVSLAGWTYDEGANVETIDSISVPTAPPRAYQNALGERFPNPGNPEIWIPFTLSEAEHVVIRIYSATGRLVRTLDLGQKAPGAYMNKEEAAYWDGRNEAGDKVTSGIYFYLMEAGTFRAVKKLAILK